MVKTKSIPITITSNHKLTAHYSKVPEPRCWNRSYIASNFLFVDGGVRDIDLLKPTLNFIFL